MKLHRLNRRVLLIALLFSAVTLFFFVLIGYDMTAAEGTAVSAEASSSPHSTTRIMRLCSLLIMGFPPGHSRCRGWP